MFALVDCNNFYVSCELVFNPGLQHRPVVVLSNNDGCIISRSDQAKQLGLKMGEPAFLKRAFLKKHKVHLFSSNYTLYGDMSNRVMNTLAQFSPVMEIYSIDECFLDLSMIQNNALHSYSKKIKKTVEQNTGIPVSIGLAPTKTLAKIANRIAKTNDKCQGVYSLDDPRKIDCALRNTPVEEVWGVGRQYASFLKKHQIDTAHKLSTANDQWVRKKMTVIGLRVKKELGAESCIPMELMVPSKKAIATTRAFGQKINDPELIREAVATYAVRCTEKLRKQKSLANIITVFIHTDPFNPNEPQYRNSKTISFPVSTNNQMEIIQFSLQGLQAIYRKEYKYKKAGVILDGIEDDRCYQQDIFDEKNRDKLNNLNDATDKINNKYGRDTIKYSVQGNGQEWKLRQNMLSRRYTTRLKEIIEINAK